MRNAALRARSTARRADDSSRWARSRRDRCTCVRVCAPARAASARRATAANVASSPSSSGGASSRAASRPVSSWALRARSNSREARSAAATGCSASTSPDTATARSKCPRMPTRLSPAATRWMQATTASSICGAEVPNCCTRAPHAARLPGEGKQTLKMLRGVDYQILSEKICVAECSPNKKTVRRLPNTAPTLKYCVAFRRGEKNVAWSVGAECSPNNKLCAEPQVRRGAAPPKNIAGASCPPILLWHFFCDFLLWLSSVTFLLRLSLQHALLFGLGRLS